MSSRAPVTARRWFHRYIALLFAVMFPVLAVVEITRAGVDTSPAALRGVGYLVLGIWALMLTRSNDTDAMRLVLVAIGFFASLSIIEALFGVEVSLLDFATVFGLVMMLGVLAGALTAGRRLVWAGAVGLSLAVWSLTMGVLLGDDLEVMAVRALVAVSGIVFTTALVSRLYDEVSGAIGKFERSRRLQDAIARCSEALLVQTDSFAVYEAIRALLDASEADYAYVDKTIDIDGEPGWEIVADAARRSAGYGNAWRTASYAAAPTSYEPLAKGNAYVVHTRDLEGDERRLYEEDGIVTEAVVPIFIGDEFRGSIGFVQYTEERLWSEAEVQTLWRASHMIGAYWKRQEDAADLRESNDSKERLLASVSHEIRTPLTAIVGLSEEILASQSSLGEDELAELNGIIALQSRELAELVEDLLVASRADGGTLSIKPTELGLRAQAEDVLRGLRESHPTDKSIIFHGDEVIAWADPLRVRQIMRNLITNAIKYGGDRIVVGVSHQDDAVRLLVADDGPGVPVEESDLIFDRYYRSAQTPTQPGSVGIGLAVSRQLAEMMDGSLAYVSDARQHHFELLLPLVPVHRELGGLLEGSATG